MIVNKTFYNVNIRRYVQRLSTAFDKSTFTVRWLAALCYPLHEHWQVFRSFTIAQRDEGYANSQTGLLEARLNKAFDPILKRIYIVNHTLNYLLPLEYHFTVHIPTVLTYGNSDSVRRFVSNYVLVDKNFDIVIS